jgi:hypothetical protein
VNALVSFAWLLAACGDSDDGGDRSSAADQESADEAIAAVEQSLRDDGFSAADDGDDDDDDDDLTFESDECQEFDEALSASAGASLPGQTASAETDTYEFDELAQGGVAESVNASAEFVEEQDQLDVVDEMLNDERLETCFEERSASGSRTLATRATPSRSATSRPRSWPLRDSETAAAASRSRRSSPRRA